MAGFVGAAGHFVECFGLWVPDLVRMQVVFCFEVAKDEVLMQLVKLSFRLEFLQRFVQGLEFSLFQF